MLNTLTDFTIQNDEGTHLKLGIEGFAYADLYRPEKLKELAELFYQQLRENDAELYSSLQDYIAARGRNTDPKVQSNLLIASARYLSSFVARLFGVESERDKMIAETHHQDTIFELKHFVARRALKTFTEEQAASIDIPTINSTLERLCEIVSSGTHETDKELVIARTVSKLLAWEKQIDACAKKNEELPLHISHEINSAEMRAEASDSIERINFHAREAGESETFTSDHARFVKLALRIIEAWAAVHALCPEARFKVRGWVSFKSPHSLDYQQLVKIERPRETTPEEMRAPMAHLRRRDGFGLTDARASKREVLDEVNYCIYCHEREKDSCSKGFHERDGQVKRNPLGIELAGCPLDEKISEMHLLTKEGDSIAALALVVIDNPMCPGTGHRICNDCMKACIFQKQDPVNIPQAETGVLTDVLELPYGFEIYSLLTRWNPINPKRPYSLPFNGRNILVVGLGPAGYTLAHYLLNEGFGVVGIDGLKIEPLGSELTGSVDRVPRPIRDIKEIYEDLDNRILSGFGGVSEYGITVRWDKNFLTLINLTLARRKHFRSYGGIRFGGTVMIEDAWELGFDHIAIATGAGRPTIIPMKNNLIKGIRQASDFLMALQLTGAFKRDTLANLQVRLPAIVIGGGLTAIDTATETFAYYPVQVEKILTRYEGLVGKLGEEKFWSLFNAEVDMEERNVLEEFITHGRAVRDERLRALAAGEDPDFVSLVRSWGGVSIVYRKRLQDSPAYRLNHEEVEKSLEEGISFIENMNPVEAVPDEFGAVKAVIFERMKFDSDAGHWTRSGELVGIPACSVQVAAGTSPNTTYEKEFPSTFALDEWHSFFAPHKAVRGEDGRFHMVPAAADERAFFTSYQKDGRFITYYGDNHPVYAGNVVKAMASAKDGYEQVVALFAEEIAALDATNQQKRNESFAQLVQRLDDQLIARVVRVDRLTPTIVDVVVRAPMQARKFHPGQFYRLQNFETTAPQIGGTRLMMEGLALTGAWVDKEQGLL
ncbi:MAG: FAD-dependent oxidoreductase, partial [Pyrinomonadaceae bacterium]